MQDSGIQNHHSALCTKAMANPDSQASTVFLSRMLHQYLPARTFFLMHQLLYTCVSKPHIVDRSTTLWRILLSLIPDSLYRGENFETRFVVRDLLLVAPSLAITWAHKLDCGLFDKATKKHATIYSLWLFFQGAFQGRTWSGLFCEIWASFPTKLVHVDLFPIVMPTTHSRLPSSTRDLSVFHSEWYLTQGEHEEALQGALFYIQMLSSYKIRQLGPLAHILSVFSRSPHIRF